MQNTTNYNLKKPDYTDFADIKDINDNMDIIDQKLASPDGDARDEVVTFTDDDLDTGITSFGTYLSKIVSGMKLAKFIRDFKAGMQYVLHKGSLINNGTCNTAGEYALDAAYGKVLRDDIDSLNSSFVSADNWRFLKALNQSNGYTVNLPEDWNEVYISTFLGEGLSFGVPLLAIRRDTLTDGYHHIRGGFANGSETGQVVIGVSLTSIQLSFANKNGSDVKSTSNARVYYKPGYRYYT